MRRVSPKIGKSALRVAVAAFLASAATGCSSDVSRFGGLFDRTENITTNSIPRRTITGMLGEQAPIPRENVAQGGSRTPMQPMMSSREEALNQPFPEQASVSYEPVNTGTISGSGARMASRPAAIQRSELPDPGAAAPSRPRDVAMAQPMPSRSETRPSARLEPIVTGSTPQKSTGWTTFNAPNVRLKSGETVSTISRRYGVPEKEILKANGLKSASAVQPGQTLVIPTYGAPRNVAKASAEQAELPEGGKPVPSKAPEKVAVLPSANTLRDKAQASADSASGKLPPADGGKPQKTTEAAPGNGYVVKPGDSLAKIAKANGVSVEQLKAANGMSTASLRIGQTLTLPAAGSAAADNVKTASIPAKKAEDKASASAAKPQEYKAPVAAAKQTVTEVASKTDVDDAPERTGIGKYRWPVRGAVVAAYGANVAGSRNDGIDISVPEGTPVKAAENGVVIYAGNGLKELGNTVLVRHDDGTVTVYGHTNSLNVARGQKVQRGQTIASSGMSGNANAPKLHFEVRKNATPVNPMTYLD